MEAADISTMLKCRHLALPLGYERLRIEEVIRRTAGTGTELQPRGRSQSRLALL